MPTSALLSIKPEFAEAILEGRKTYEFRRRIFQKADVRRVVIYSSSPVQRVVGEFTADEILALAPAKLWSVTSDGAAVSRKFFDDYFRGTATGFAVKIGNPRRFVRPRKLKDYCGLRQPPQSFCYLNAGGN